MVSIASRGVLVVDHGFTMVYKRLVLVSDVFFVLVVDHELILADNGLMAIIMAIDGDKWFNG